jgi:hypothetical protein
LFSCESIIQRVNGGKSDEKERVGSGVVGVFSSICSALPSYIEQGQMTWQRGAAGSTWQEWTFENGNNPSVPDNYYNPYGNPSDPTMLGR